MQNYEALSHTAGLRSKHQAELGIKSRRIDSLELLEFEQSEKRAQFSFVLLENLISATAWIIVRPKEC